MTEITKENSPNFTKARQARIITFITCIAMILFVKFIEPSLKNKFTGDLTMLAFVVGLTILLTIGMIFLIRSYSSKEPGSAHRTFCLVSQCIFLILALTTIAGSFFI